MGMKMILNKCISFFIGRKLEPKKPIRRNTLTITLHDSNMVRVYKDDWQGTDNREPWMDFFNWFEKESTEHFFITYEVGETLIKRSSINSIYIRVTAQ